MLQNYSDDCDYLREKFDLPTSVTLYQMVNRVANHFRDERAQVELELAKAKTTSTKVEPISAKAEPKKGNEQCQTTKPKKQLQNQ